MGFACILMWRERSGGSSKGQPADGRQVKEPCPSKTVRKLRKASSVRAGGGQLDRPWDDSDSHQAGEVCRSRKQSRCQKDGQRTMNGERAVITDDDCFAQGVMADDGR